MKPAALLPQVHDELRKLAEDLSTLPRELSALKPIRNHNQRESAPSVVHIPRPCVRIAPIGRATVAQALPRAKNPIA